MIPQPRTVLPVALLLGASACTFAPDPPPVAPVRDLPADFRAADSLAGDGAGQTPVRWWTAFEDPVLDRLIDTVLVANLDLAEAVTRVQEARALAGVARADLLPSVTGEASASRSDSPRNAGFGNQLEELLGGLRGDTAGMGDGGDQEPDGEGGSDRFTTTDYSASLGLSYELDFWGRARNDRAAALAELAAGESDYRTARLGVMAEAITAYFELLDLTSRIDLTAEIVDVLAEREELTERRYDRGLATSLELYQVRQDLRNAQAGLPLLRAQRTDVRRRLALVAGRFPGELEPLLAEAGSPVVPEEPIPAGIPAELLDQRPDVRAARRRLEATRLRVGARKAELLPSVSVSAGIGLQSSEARDLFDLNQWFSNLASNLVAPIFQGGRLRSNVDAAQARMARQVAVYGRTVITAVGDVEVALVRHREERERYDFLQAQLEEARASVELQADRYAAGVGGYTDYLDALRNRLAVETTLTQSRRDLALARLGVHRALGGSWTRPPDEGPVRQAGAGSDGPGAGAVSAAEAGR